MSLSDYNRIVAYNPAPNPWYLYYFGTGMLIYILVLPLAVSIMPYVVKTVEDKADAWKRTLIIPYPIFGIHLSKVMVIWMYASLFVGLTLIGFIVSGLLLSYLKPEFNFAAYPTYHKFLIILFFKSELAALSIVTFGYSYMLFVKKTLTSLLLTIFLPLVCLLILPPYSSAGTQYFLFRRERHMMLGREGYTYNDLHLDLINSMDAICIGVIFFSLIIIMIKSTKSTIDYE